MGVTPVSPSKQPAGMPPPKQQPGVSSSGSFVRQALGAWMEGVRVVGRWLWFSLHLSFMMVPCQIMVILITGKTDWEVFAKGPFDGRAAIAVAVGLVYFPLACYGAARCSGYLGRRGAR
jgi:CHASE2 domain-containing sensor protein